MWLLNATSKHIRAFLPDKIPASGYAILSHTWDSDPDNEVLFSDFETTGGHRAYLPSACRKRRWRKIELACGQALNDGYAWIWVDTCCIDKSSSSELSEAINSMYAWYRDSAVCYAFLSDLPADTNLKSSKLGFQNSQWFKRGWTLQELLAPQKVVFYVDNGDGPALEQTKDVPGSTEPISGTVSDPIATASWIPIGDKTHLCGLVSSITGVDIDILMDPEALGNASIAQRMSWASSRVTSRPEDMAYCLMGIFGVNMPMLYGEGAEKAFLRLQEEIMKSSDDQSLFAWCNERALPQTRYGLLATSPTFFRGANRIVPYQDWRTRPPYVMTNRGLQIDLPLRRLETENKTRYAAVLDCPVPPDYQDHCFLTIVLEKLNRSDLQFARVEAHQLGSESNLGQVQQVFVRQQQGSNNHYGVFPHHVFRLRQAKFRQGTYTVVDFWTPEGAGVDDNLAITAKTTQWPCAQMPMIFRIGKVPWAQVAGALLFERTEDGERLLVRLGSVGSTTVGFDAVRLLPKHRALLDGKASWGRQAADAFAPRPSSDPMVLKYHQVEVAFAEPLVHKGTKYINFDIEITATSFAERTAGSSRDMPVLRSDKPSAAHGWKRS